VERGVDIRLFLLGTELTDAHWCVIVSFALIPVLFNDPDETKVDSRITVVIIV